MIFSENQSFLSISAPDQNADSGSPYLKNFALKSLHFVFRFCCFPLQSKEIALQNVVEVGRN